jgi:hypothetical protein
MHTPTNNFQVMKLVTTVGQVAGSLLAVGGLCYPCIDTMVTAKRLEGRADKTDAKLENIQKTLTKICGKLHVDDN